jgi:CRISPR-associated endoribonuclease Cas6
MREFENVDVPNDVLYAISDSVIITDYNLRSVTYHIKRNNTITGFKGEIKCELIDPKSDISAALMLLMRYACYSGVGAKTALGMGGILLSE